MLRLSKAALRKGGRGPGGGESSEEEVGEPEPSLHLSEYDPSCVAGGGTGPGEVQETGLRGGGAGGMDIRVKWGGVGAGGVGSG